jgi:ABC-type glycerol-3-phosphate transport system substrate-binding protein
MAKAKQLSRRAALKLGVAATALPLVHIRTAGAAGKLSIGFWDHWVPGGNDVMQQQVNAWAEKHKVEVNADFITGNGGKLQTTGVAEAQAKTGHDVYTFYNWDVYNIHDSLAPLDDVMQRLEAQNGKASETAKYLAYQKNHWTAVPTSSGTQAKPPCARISWFKKHGLDVQAMYPAKPGHNAMQDQWTYDALLKYAELAKQDGMAFALGIGSNNNTDGIDMVGAMFHAFGANLIDVEGTLHLDSPEVMQCLEYAQKLVKALPDDAVSFDDASNNRGLIAGKSALIFNPPSAWAVAKRDAPQVAEDCWTFSAPTGPKGRFVPTATFFWGVWGFSRNQSAGKELVEYLMQRPQVEARDNKVDGYDLPPYGKLTDFKIWEEVSPPHGTVYNYPIRPWHGAQPSLTSSEAAPDVAVQIYNRAVHNQMLARMKNGQPIKQVLAWAKDEIQGYLR